jgi:hypothetical protein
MHLDVFQCVGSLFITSNLDQRKYIILKIKFETIIHVALTMNTTSHWWENQQRHETKKWWGLIRKKHVVSLVKYTEISKIRRNRKVINQVDSNSQIKYYKGKLDGVFREQMKTSRSMCNHPTNKNNHNFFNFLEISIVNTFL